MSKKTISIIAVTIIFFTVLSIWINQSLEYTFEEIIDQDVNDFNDISHMVIDTNVNIEEKRLWTNISESESIEQFLTMSQDTHLKETLSNDAPTLKNMITFYAPNNSYSYHFGSDKLVANGVEYEIVDGDMESFINNLDLQWRKYP